MKFKLLIFSIFLFYSNGATAQDKFNNDSNSRQIKVFNPVDGEEDLLDLRIGEFGNVKVFLGSLGDMVDKYMITLLNMDTNELAASGLSSEDGEVTFRKIPPGSYSVYVNKRVMEDGEMSSVKVTDVKLSTFP